MAVGNVPPQLKDKRLISLNMANLVAGTKYRGEFEERLRDVLGVLYEKFKALDPSRIFDATSGWFEETKSDVKSEHIYFKKIALAESTRPLVLSEFGGYSCKIKGHAFNLDKTYGYRYFNDKNEFMTAIENLYGEEIVPMIKKGLCATVLTQVSDVEDETNGLFTYDRQVLKVDTARMQAVANELFSTFDAITKE